MKNYLGSFVLEYRCISSLLVSNAQGALKRELESPFLSNRSGNRRRWRSFDREEDGIITCSIDRSEIDKSPNLHTVAAAAAAAVLKSARSPPPPPMKLSRRESFQPFTVGEEELLFRLRAQDVLMEQSGETIPRPKLVGTTREAPKTYRHERGQGEETHFLDGRREEASARVGRRGLKLRRAHTLDRDSRALPSTHQRGRGCAPSTDGQAYIVAQEGHEALHGRGGRALAGTGKGLHVVQAYAGIL